MSIEYTIDIQLTELGFPDILQRQDASTGQTMCRSPPANDTQPPKSTPLSIPHKQLPQPVTKEKEFEAQTENPKPPDVSVPSLPGSEKSSCPRLAPAPSLQVGQNANETAVNNLTAGSGTPILLLQLPVQNMNVVTVSQEKTVSQEESSEDDSDDSEVSDDYEEDYLEEELDDDEEELSSESSSSGGYSCSVCQLQLPSKSKLQDHMNMHTGARPYCCAECGKRFCQIHSYRVHLRAHAKVRAEAERIQCRICQLNFKTLEDLRIHLSETHFEQQFYECDLCKRVFTKFEDCKLHVELHMQMGLLKFACEVCNRSFPSKKLLFRHQRKRCHRRFKCTDCSETFPRKNALLKHSFSHLGLLPYTCLSCRCHFRLAKLYCRHKCEPQRIHCIACLREFLSEKEFKQHKIDTGCWGNQETKAKTDEIRCLECGEKFETTEELKKHAGAHQRVLKCAECGKGFRSALLLMSHMGGHVGKSPCLCKSCGLGFPHQQNYDSHLKTCGQTPLPVSAFEKRQTLNSSMKENRSVFSKPESSEGKSIATAPVSKIPAAVAETPTAVLKEPTEASKPSTTVLKNYLLQKKKPTGPPVVKGGKAAGSSSSDGSRKLKKPLPPPPPPGLGLFMLVPVCPTQSGKVCLTPVMTQTVALPAMQAPTQVSLPSTPTNRLFETYAASGVPLNTPLDIQPGNDMDPNAPLDLSKKSAPPQSSTIANIQLPSVKMEEV